MKKKKLKLDLYAWGTEMMRDCHRYEAEKHFKNRDGELFAYAGYEDHCMFALVRGNTKILIEKGMYEAALVAAISHPKRNNFDWSPSFLYSALYMADKDKIRAITDPIPEGDKFTLYRGVAGPRYRRFARSISWTDDFDVAAWFACRYKELEDPAVYKTTVSRKSIVYFHDYKGEREFIVSGLGRMKRMDITHKKMLEASKRFLEKRDKNIKE